MLLFRGAPALSAFRIERLLATIAGFAPSIRGLRADYLHFVDTSRPLTPAERARARTPARLRRLGARRTARTDACSPCHGPARSRRGRRRRPTSRTSAGSTRCAASSAGAVAHRRQRRSAGAGLGRDRRRAARPDDGDVLTHAADAARLFERSAGPARAHRARRPMPRPRSRAANAALGLALSDDEIAYLADVFARARPRSDGRRADDVRAGEQRALPAQDLQCRLASTAARSRARCSR